MSPAMNTKYDIWGDGATASTMQDSWNDCAPWICLYLLKRHAGQLFLTFCSLFGACRLMSRRRLCGRAAWVDPRACVGVSARPTMSLMDRSCVDSRASTCVLNRATTHGLLHWQDEKLTLPLSAYLTLFYLGQLISTTL